MFNERTLLIVTKHEKEKVIAPILEKELGVKCFIAENFDTDELGTFSGEIERQNDPITTVREKCVRGMKLANCDLVVASEGSFGPHPVLGFINADDEILMLIDTRNDLEIFVRELSINTNFNGQEIKTEEALVKFSDSVKFPSHGLIIRKNHGDNSEIIKGITNLSILKDTFKTFKSKYGAAYVETDMRALYNPTRMEVIKTAAKKLADKIISCCPQCFTPGFGITSVKGGLPCSLCGFPTKSTLSHEYECVKCQYKMDKKYPHNKTTEEPTFCDICNP